MIRKIMLKVLINRAEESENLDLGGVFDALIVALDLWVDQGVEPPADSPDSSDRPEGEEHIVIQLPEVACPTGIYYEFPAGVGRVGVTGFQAYLDGTPADPFDEALLEPMDRRGYPVDMNHNGIRDRRETLTQAWQRRRQEGEHTGILEAGETFTHAHYLNCVRGVATTLFEQRLLSRSAMLDHIQKAADSSVGKSSNP